MENSYQINIPDNVTSDIIYGYIESMKDSLIKGKRFYIKGVGFLIPKFRRVKNDQGRDFTITIRLKQDPEFSESIISSCLEDVDKFK